MYGAINWAINWALWAFIIIVLAYGAKTIGLYDLSAASLGYWWAAIIAAAMALFLPVVDA